MRTFGDGKSKDEAKNKEVPSEEEEEKEDEIVDLDLKKNFYYVIGPQSEVVDCAKIYSFLHEDNIFQRIIARVNKHGDSKINPG